jgi:hypothetical protein
MSIGRLVRAVAFATPALTIVAVALALTLGSRSTYAGAGVDFSIAVSLTQDGPNICNSGAPGPSTCVIPGETDAFTIKVLLNDRADNTYLGYDSAVLFAGVQPGGVSTTSSASWPDCGFPAAILANPKLLRMGCAAGISVAPSSYVGQLGRTGGVCVTGGGTVTLQHGATETALDGLWFETEGSTESLMITCGGGGGETPTEPTGATPTNTGQAQATSTLPPTATRTPTISPTRTNTRTPTIPSEKEMGDVNDDGSVDSVDALMVLDYEAGTRSSLINLESADVSDDGEVNSIDALFILWIEAELI